MSELPVVKQQQLGWKKCLGARTLQDTQAKENEENNKYRGAHLEKKMRFLKRAKNAHQPLESEIGLRAIFCNFPMKGYNWQGGQVGIMFQLLGGSMMLVVLVIPKRTRSSDASSKEPHV